MDQANDDFQRKALACIAVARGVRRARLATVKRHPEDQPHDCRATRVIVVEHLREEQAKGHKRRVDAILELDALGGQRRLDHVGVEDLVKGKSVGVAE